MPLTHRKALLHWREGRALSSGFGTEVTGCMTKLSACNFVHHTLFARALEFTSFAARGSDARPQMPITLIVICDLTPKMMTAAVVPTTALAVTLCENAHHGAS